MKLQEWEATIRQIVDASHEQPKESGKFRVLMEWRKALSLAPHLLQPHQIDEIVREVRKRLTLAATAAAPDTQLPLAAAGAR